MCAAFRVRWQVYVRAVSAYIGEQEKPEATITVPAFHGRQVKKEQKDLQLMDSSGRFWKHETFTSFVSIYQNIYRPSSPLHIKYLHQPISSPRSDILECCPPTSLPVGVIIKSAFNGGRRGWLKPFI